MIGEAVDYALYFFAQRAGTSASEGVERIWPTLRLGTLTSVCGFSAMLFSGFPGLAQLGVYSVAGLVAALLATRWVLPILAGRAAPVASADATRMRIAQTILARLPGRRASTWALGALTACAALWLVLDRHTLWETDLANLSPASAEDKARDERLRRDLGAPDLRLLLVARSATQQGALEAAERASQRLDALRTQGELKSYDTPTRYLPSLRTQRERQAAVPEGDVLRPRLAEALRGLPFAPNVFEPFLRDVLAARVQAPLDAHSLAGTALAIKVDTLLMRTDDGYAALLPLSGVRDAAALAQDLLGDASLSLLDLKGETAALVDDYRREAARYALAGVLLIVLLLALTLRSVSRVVHVLAPLVAAVVLTCALLHGLGARLSLFHLVALLLVVGVGSNYALFFDRREGNAEERLRMAATLALCSATTLIAFGLLAFSAAPVLHAIGLTVAAGAVLCLGCSALIVRAR
jgi:predicted exporter